MNNMNNKNKNEVKKIYEENFQLNKEFSKLIGEETLEKTVNLLNKELTGAPNNKINENLKCTSRTLIKCIVFVSKSQKKILKLNSQSKDFQLNVKIITKGIPISISKKVIENNNNNIDNLKNTLSNEINLYLNQNIDEIENKIKFATSYSICQFINKCSKNNANCDLILEELNRFNSCINRICKPKQNKKKKEKLNSRKRRRITE